MSNKLNNKIDLTESNEDKEFHKQTKEEAVPTFEKNEYSCDDSISDNTIEDSEIGLIMVYDKAKNKHKLNSGTLHQHINHQVKNQDKQ